jgi:hypothetical protein
MLSKFGKLFRKTNLRNLASDVAIASGMGFAGDIVCQTAFEGKKFALPGSGKPHSDSVDWVRVQALTTFNAVYIGGFLHYLFQVKVN